MWLNRITVLFLVICLNSIAQKTDISKCRGSVLVNGNISYSLNFLGNKKFDELNLFGYCNFPNISNNYIWLNFSPSSFGNLNIEFSNAPDSLMIFIFECKMPNPCEEIINKTANLIVCHYRRNKDANSQIKPIFVNQNSTYFIAFNTKKGSRSAVDFRLKFDKSTSTGEYLEDSLSLNLVSRYDKAIYSLHLVDEKTNKPVVSRIYISSTGDLDGAYKASDLRINNTKNLNANIRIDAEGYFSKDLLKHKIVGNMSSHDTIRLVAITSGTIAKLDDINFIGGLSIISDESIPKLKRLKDFLALNPSISIEIQGHVNDEGKNSMSSQRLSKKRAQKIMLYLVQNGIKSERLKAIGFGNSKPLYENPTDDDQREANRRVEIKIN